MPVKGDIKTKGLLAALTLAADTPWSELTLAAIAEQAKIDLGAFHGVATKDDLEAAFDAHFDKAMSADAMPDDNDARERLFDVIMRRYEAMEPYREGILSLMRSLDRSPAALVTLPVKRRNSAEWALVSAGLDTDKGAPLTLKVLGIAVVIAQVERAWRKDLDGDFAHTMAALDKGLRSAESRMAWLQRMSGRYSDRDSEPEETA